MSQQKIKKYSYFKVDNEKKIVILHHVRHIPMSEVPSLDLELWDSADRQLIKQFLGFKLRSNTTNGGKFVSHLFQYKK